MYSIYLCYADLFKLLIKSSPIGLNKFKFEFNDKFHKLVSLKLFLNGWNNRHPISL